MSIAADTFSRFVDVLEETFDQPGVDGADVASRAHMSRFHFDRVVAAAAGEAPGAFRRRVMLERSAYRLLTSDRGVLDIAVEAGYSSNEAFTRAFARAYGQTPSRWRKRPTRIQIQAPSDVHFHPPGGLRLPARTKVSSVDLIVKMVEHHIWLVGEMIERASKVDDAVLDRPIEINVEGIDTEPTIRKLLSRLVGQMNMWVNVIGGRPYSFEVERHESVEDMRRRLDAVGPAFLDEVRRVVDGDRLDETFIDAQHEPVETYTYGGLIAHVLTFAAHRRILVLGALESAGIPDLGNGDPRKWVIEAA